MINLTAKTNVQRTLITPANLAITSNLLFLGFVVVMPGAVIFLGVVSWVLHRRRG